MKKFIVKIKKDDSIIGIFDSKQEASEFVTDVIDDNQIDTIFDVVCEEKDIEDYPLTYKDACELLGISEGTIVMESNEGGCIGSGVIVSKSCVGLVKSAVAFYKLRILAKAWNKIDGFEPDFSNVDQSKYFPWFRYDSDAAGFVYAGVNHAKTHTKGSSGIPICFGSPEAAEEFGKMFNGLYNEMFL